MAQIVNPIAGAMPTLQSARIFGEAVAGRALGPSRDIAHRAEKFASSSRSSIADQLISARGLVVKSRATLQITSANAADLASRAYAKAKDAAADRRVRRVAATIAMLAVTAAVRRHPAGALASSALSLMETIAQSDVFRRGWPAAPRWQVELARFAGKHTWKRIGQTGGLATFTYVDANGVVTERMVRNWRSTGRLIRAHCLLRQQVRSFRIDRIDGWSEPE